MDEKKDILYWILCIFGMIFILGILQYIRVTHPGIPEQNSQKASYDQILRLEYLPNNCLLMYPARQNNSVIWCAEAFIGSDDGTLWIKDPSYEQLMAYKNVGGTQ